MHFNPTTKCNTTNKEDENLDEHSINNEHKQDEEILKINETPIPEVSSTKFLGVTIDNRLSCTNFLRIRAQLVYKIPYRRARLA